MNTTIIRGVNNFNLIKLNHSEMYRVEYGTQYSYWLYSEDKDKLIDLSNNDFEQNCKELLELSLEIL